MPPASAKNRCAASQIDSADAATLNRIRKGVLYGRSNCAESTSPSSAAVTAPADGPKSTADAMLNVSEIEKLISVFGMRSMTQPVPAVSATRMSHFGSAGWLTRSQAAWASTTLPNPMTLYIVIHATRLKEGTGALMGCRSEYRGRFADLTLFDPGLSRMGRCYWRTSIISPV